MSETNLSSFNVSCQTLIYAAFNDPYM